MTLHRPHTARALASNRGFTLVELMIVVLIVGILAAFAIPSYNDYVRRGEISEASTFLSNYRVTMEQYYQDNRDYGNGACANGAVVAQPNGTKYFSYSCTSAGQTYLLKATGQAGTGMLGYEFTVDESNNRVTTSFKGVGVNKPCWLSRGSEC